ncbi:hypothetical protein E4T56_gene422 [Termitomyces sp. T112]|nr:hypothetical protein E4T56_gene422 [Termitomyces sp. T112]
MGFEPWACPSENDSVNKFVDQMKRAQEEAKAALVKAKEDMAWYYDCRQTPAPVYKPRNCVYVDSSDIKTTRPSQKLSHCHLGPFTVEKKVEPLAYQLKLPAGLCQLHLVFNVVKLFSAPEDLIPGCCPKPPPSPVLTLAPLPVLPNAPPNSPNPCPPSAPTPGNPDTSSANPNGPLINSDTFSAAVDASPKFP